MIVLATPTRDSITAGTTGDIVALCRRRPDVKFCAPLGIYIAALRQQAVTLARQAGASHLLFIDADMRFPEDTLDRLIAHDKDVVCANYVQRTFPDWWVARKGGASISSVGRSGLESVDSVGCGVMLIRLSLFDYLPRPWFDTPNDGQVFTGEDVYFCEKVRLFAANVWIDHDLSQHVRHQGMVEYSVRNAPTLVPE